MFDPQDKKKQRKEMLQALNFFSQIGIMVLACVGIGVFIGRSLDRWLGTSPWLLLVFSLLGAGAAFKALFDYAGKK